MTPPRLRRLPSASASLIAILALAFRWPSDSTPSSLGYDELQSVTFASLPPGEMLRVLPRLDPHPPLYYLQLHYWPGLLAGDAALRWNSALWSVAAVLLFWWGTTQLFGAGRGWLASFLFLLNPLASMYAGSVRMYAMLMALAGVVYCGVAIMERARGRREVAAGVVMAATAAAAAGWSQGAGFLLPAALTVYCGLRAVWPPRAEFRTVFPLAASVVACAAVVPWLLHAREVQVGHLYRPDIWQVASSLKQLFFAQVRWPSRPVYFLIAGAALALCGVAAWRSRRAFRLVACFIVLPMVLCAALSLLMHPIWDVRTFAWCIPFLCVAASLALYPRYRSKPGRILAALGLFALFGGTFNALRHPVYLDEGYRDCAAYVREHYPKDAVVYAPKRDLWCLGWYAGGKGTIHPLDTTSVQGDFQITSVATADMAENRRYVLMVCREGHEADLEPARKLLHAELLTHAAFGRVELYAYSVPPKTL